MTTPTLEDIQAWQRVVGATPDGNPGPRTHSATVEWFRAHGYIKPPELPTEARSRVVTIAAGELGPQDPDKYWRLVCPALMGNPHGISWCGGFALWCLRTAGLCDWNWKPGLGFLELHGMPKVSLPEPGDIAYFSKGQHHAVVERCADGYVHTIDGNAMTAPKEGVERRKRPISEAAAYYSIRNLA